MVKKLLKLRPIFYFAFLLFFALIPTAAVLNKSFCPLFNLTHIKCAGCGVTRAFTLFMHLNFKDAMSYNNVFTISVFPISIFLMLEDSLVLLLRKLKKIKRLSLLEKAFSLFK